MTCVHIRRPWHPMENILFSTGSWTKEIPDPASAFYTENRFHSLKGPRATPIVLRYSWNRIRIRQNQMTDRYYLNKHNHRHCISHLLHVEQRRTFLIVTCILKDDYTTSRDVARGITISVYYAFRTADLVM